MVSKKQKNIPNRSEQTFDELAKVFKHAKDKSSNRPEEEITSELESLKRAFLRHQEDPSELNFNQFDQTAVDLYWESMEAHDLMDFDDPSQPDYYTDREGLQLEPTFSDNDRDWLDAEQADVAFDRIVDLDEMLEVEEFDESSFSLGVSRDD